MTDTTKLHKLRTAQNLPLVVLADRADVALATVHNWDKYDIRPKTSALRLRIAEALGVSLADLEDSEMP